MVSTPSPLDHLVSYTTPITIEWSATQPVSLTTSIGSDISNETSLVTATWSTPGTKSPSVSATISQSTIVMTKTAFVVANSKTLTPSEGGNLVYLDTSGTTVIVQVPPDAVDTTTELTYSLGNRLLANVLPA